MSNIKNILLSFAMVLVSYLSIPAVETVAKSPIGQVQAAECTLYETIHPNFPLTGAHLSVGKCSTCASCHAGGVFLGTPKICATCHNGTPSSATVGRSSAHIPIGSVNCDSCHNTSSFTASWHMTHSTVGSQRCDACHNGSYAAYGAMPKATNHIPTTNDCGSCHSVNDTPTHTNSDWMIPINVIHNGITTGCVSCHNGTNATGKTNYAPGHPTTSDQCETCHSINNSFKCTWLFDLIDFIKNWFA